MRVRCALFSHNQKLYKAYTHTYIMPSTSVKPFIHRYTRYYKTYLFDMNPEDLNRWCISLMLRWYYKEKQNMKYEIKLVNEVLMVRAIGETEWIPVEADPDLISFAVACFNTKNKEE